MVGPFAVVVVVVVLGGRGPGGRGPSVNTNKTEATGDVTDHHAVANGEDAAVDGGPTPGGYTATVEETSSLSMSDSFTWDGYVLLPLIFLLNNLLNLTMMLC